MTIEVIKPSWEDIESIVGSLIPKIENTIDYIIAIQRGGLIPATILSHKLAVREVIVIRSSRTLGDEINSKKSTPIVYKNEDLRKIKNKRVIIVDDIVGTGETIKMVKKTILSYNPSSVLSFTCYLNTNNWDKSNKVSPGEIIDQIGVKVNGWVLFPWETLIF